MDKQDLFSANQPDQDLTACPLVIREVVDELKAAYGDDQVRVVHWNDYYVGIALTVPVNIPTRGPVGGVDIRSLEPIVLLLHKERYPHFAPSVRSDRQDFPVTQLPHLNPVLAGQPASLCLHRGNIHDWFAEHTIIDLVVRTQDWLRDAASNRLIRQQDHFEPTRPDIELLVGMAIYDQQRIESYIEDRWKANHGKPGKTYLQCHLLSLDQSSASLDRTLISVRLGMPLPRSNALSYQENILSFYRGHSNIPSIALLVWPAENQVCHEYFGVLPHDFDSLVRFAEPFGLPLKQELQRYWSQCSSKPPGMRFSPLLPVILAVRRPQPLVGSDSPVEFLTFLICAVGQWRAKRTGWLPETPVRLLSHRTPLAPEMARRLSGFPNISTNDRLLLIGCGALGSKIGLHLARAGLTNLTLVDDDELSPHNLVRHGLLAEQLGQNKALALKQAIEAIFAEHQQAIGVKAIPENAFEVIRGNQQALLSDHSRIIDCSASVSVLNLLVDSTLNLPIIRCELTDDGRLGVLMCEGRGRNPRIDDLQMQLYDLAIDDDEIAAWLQRQKRESSEIGSGLEEITIGLGCSSATMRMADDVISYHAALAAMSLKKRLSGDEERAGIYVSHLEDDLVTWGNMNFHEVAPVQVLIPLNTPNWTVRLSHSASSDMQAQMAAALPNETGGLLVGFIHYKRKIIYVTRALPAPPDSAGFPYAFKLGIQDVPEQLQKINQRTGGVIGYVGEWHSHPNGAKQLSATDLTAVKQISAHLQRVGIPAHIVIVTPKGFYSHLFEH